MKINGLRSLIGAAVLALGLSACSASVSSTKVEAPGSNASTTTKAAEAGANGTGSETKSDPSAQSLQIHLTASLSGMIGTDNPVDLTVVTDGPNKRFSLTTKAIEISDGGMAGQVGAPDSIPALEVRGQQGDDQTDIYVRKAGGGTWTHLVLGKDLDLGGSLGMDGVPSDLPGELTDPTELLDKLRNNEIPGVTLKDDGSVDYKGESMTRKVATIDLGEALGAMAPSTVPGAEDLGGMAEGMEDLLGSDSLAGMLPKGTVTVLIDQNSIPRKVTVELSMGDGEQGGSGSVVATIDPTDGSIELPGSDEVGKTVRIDSAEDAMQAAGELESLLDPN